MRPQNVDELDRNKTTDPITPDLFVNRISEEFERGTNEKFGRLIGPNDMWAFVLDLGLHPDPRIAFRGSWALEWAYYNDREAFRPHLPHFVDNFLKATNGSANRHYTKMMYDALHRGMLVPDDVQTEQIAEKSLDLLIDSATRTAVRVWCMEILFELTPRLAWIGGQLREILRDTMESEPSHGTANRAAKMLRRMDVTFRG